MNWVKDMLHCTQGDRSIFPVQIPRTHQDIIPQVTF